MVPEVDNLAQQNSVTQTRNKLDIKILLFVNRLICDNVQDNLFFINNGKSAIEGLLPCCQFRFQISDLLRLCTLIK